VTRISNAEQVMLLLHEQLGRLAKNRARRGDGASATNAGTPAPVDRLRALAGREDVSEDELKRALVRGLLTQQLGEAVAGDPAFEAVAGDVLRIITDSPAGRELLDRAMAQLGGAAR